MPKLVSLLVAGAVVTGGAALTTTAVVGSASSAMASSSAKSSPATRYADSLPTLRKGSDGAEVLGLQLDLRQNEGLKYLNGTGYYGANTIKAVKHFQAKHNLPVTGVADRAVWRKVIIGFVHLPNTAMAVNPQLSPGASLGTARGESLRDMTGRLIGLPWFQYNLEQSHYNGKLLAEVKTFQKRVGLQGTGVFGARTTQKMDTVIAISGNWGS